MIFKNRERVSVDIPEYAHIKYIIVGDKPYSLYVNKANLAYRKETGRAGVELYITPGDVEQRAIDAEKERATQAIQEAVMATVYRICDKVAAEKEAAAKGKPAARRTTKKQTTELQPVT